MYVATSVLIVFGMVIALAVMGHIPFLTALAMLPLVPFVTLYAMVTTPVYLLEATLMSVILTIAYNIFKMAVISTADEQKRVLATALAKNPDIECLIKSRFQMIDGYPTDTESGEIIEEPAVKNEEPTHDTKDIWLD